MAITSVTASLAATPVVRATTTWKTEPGDVRAWAREPFKKIDGPKVSSGTQGSPGAPQELALQGIMKIDKHFYAIINGRTVKTGDRIDEWTVAGISRHRVTVRREKEQQIFDIYQGRINRGTQ